MPVSLNVTLSTLALHPWRIHTERLWHTSGRPVPAPHHVKQTVVRAYARRYQMHTLVETGTFVGTMVAAMLDEFDTIYSIELSTKFYRRARVRFALRRHVHVLHGDSAIVLGDLCPTLPDPCIWWLDGHYSGGNTAKGDDVSPVLRELGHILARPPRDVILLDDARLFTPENGYPTLAQVTDLVATAWPDHRLTVRDDIIRVVPTQEGHG
jgi:hypothetical protein